MSLKSQMVTLRHRLERELPEGAFGALQAEAARRRRAGMWRSALKAGDSAPEFQMRDQSGGLARLGDLLAKGPVVICFYRGDWCRFCQLQLRALAAIDQDIRALGAFLVAIAPRSAQVSAEEDADFLPFPRLVDVGAKVSRAFGLAFTPADSLQETYEALGRPPGPDSRTALPVPATYIVDPSGMIVFSYVDSDFTSRLEPTEILVALRRLRSARVNHE